MEEKIIYLLRHGALETNGKRFIGQIDLPLSEEGVWQAKGLAEELSHLPLTRIYASDLRRARQTAEFIAAKHNLVPILCPELREISLGEWEGRSFAEIRREFPQDFIQRGRDIVHFCPPAGESFLQCSQRVLSQWQRMMAEIKGNILIVGHAGVNRIILCHILGMPLENIFCLNQDYGCINIISYSKERFRVKALNCRSIP